MSIHTVDRPMSMTLAEKIFAHHLGRDSISAGETVFAPVDLVLGTDVTAALSIKIFQEIGATKVFDPAKLVFINDHFVPAKDIASANLAARMREFALEQGIKHYFEVGRSGICHITVPEQGLVSPGDIVIGADSHTCTYGALGAFATGIGSTDMAAAWATGTLWFRVPDTIRVILKGQLRPYVSGKDIILHVIGQLGPAGASYRALEFSGPGLAHLSMAHRFTICNMAVECGAKAGLMTADETVKNYLNHRTQRQGFFLSADENAQYCKTLVVDMAEIPPLLAAPYDPTNVHEVSAFAGTPIRQVVIGSCTNGWFEDFCTVHELIKGKCVAPGVRLILVPGSPSVLKQIQQKGMLVDFIDAGAVIAPSTCGPCIGGHMGVLGDHDIGLYTTNRNFVGRNGARTAKVYLCSPATAAVSAIQGKIVNPV